MNSARRDQQPRTIRRLAETYRLGSASPRDVTLACLRRIEALGKGLNCFITVLGDAALKAAEESERRLKAGALIGPLDGIPIAVKDVFYMEGVRCTAGSRILADNVATYDSPVVKCLKEAGAVLVGTTNLHEFAAGVTSNNPFYGPVKNPWDQSRVAGGSSGGSAAAVATGMAEGATGTDTAGSVRIPAALCGVLGFKPTYGRVSRLGVVPLAASLDTIGVLTLSAWDAAAMMQAITRLDPGDITTVDQPVPDYTGSLSAPFSGARLGVIRNYFHDDIAPEVEDNFSRFLAKLRELGCTVEETDVDGVEDTYERWLVIRRAEATAFHLRWLDSSPELYGEDVRKLLELGREIRAVDYVNALNIRPGVIEGVSQAMKRFDFLMTPVTSIPAPEIGQTNAEIRGKEVTVYSALNRLTLPFNYLGFPAVSIPSGTAGGLPLGVQVVGKLFDEVGVLRLAHAYEERFGLPPLPTTLEGEGATP